MPHRHRIGPRILGEYRGYPRIIARERPEPAVRKDVQTAVADVADRQPTVDDECRDNRRAHAGVLVNGDRRLENLGVGEVNGRPNAVAAFREGGVEAEWPPRLG